MRKRVIFLAVATAIVISAVIVGVAGIWLIQRAQAQDQEATAAETAVVASRFMEQNPTASSGTLNDVLRPLLLGDGTDLRVLDEAAARQWLSSSGAQKADSGDTSLSGHYSTSGDRRWFVEAIETPTGEGVSSGNVVVFATHIDEPSIALPDVLGATLAAILLLLPGALIGSAVVAYARHSNSSRAARSRPATHEAVGVSPEVGGDV